MELSTVRRLFLYPIYTLVGFFSGAAFMFFTFKVLSGVKWFRDNFFGRTLPLYILIPTVLLLFLPISYLSVAGIDKIFRVTTLTSRMIIVMLSLALIYIAAYIAGNSWVSM